MLSKLILLTPESFEKINKGKSKDDKEEPPEDWYEMRQNMQRYLALKRQKEREESENRKYTKEKPKTLKEMNIQTDPDVTSRMKKKTLNREVQTENPIKLPPRITSLAKRKFVQEIESDNSFSDEDDEFLQRMKERKKSLRQEPKKRRLYQYGKNYNVLQNWHCF